MKTKRYALVAALALALCTTGFAATAPIEPARETNPEAKSGKAAAAARYKRIRAKAHRNAARARAHARALRAGEQTN